MAQVKRSNDGDINEEPSKKQKVTDTRSFFGYPQSLDLSPFHALAFPSNAFNFGASAFGYSCSEYNYEPEAKKAIEAFTKVLPTLKHLKQNCDNISQAMNEHKQKLEEYVEQLDLKSTEVTAKKLETSKKVIETGGIPMTHKEKEQHKKELLALRTEEKKLSELVRAHRKQCEHFINQLYKNQVTFINYKSHVAPKDVTEMLMSATLNETTKTELHKLKQEFDLISINLN